MDAEHAFYYTREVMVVLKREFQTPDEEMKKIVLKVCVGGTFLQLVAAGLRTKAAPCAWQQGG
jgi:hypothetical protein